MAPPVGSEPYIIANRARRLFHQRRDARLHHRNHIARRRMEGRRIIREKMGRAEKGKEKGGGTAGLSAPAHVARTRNGEN